MKKPKTGETLAAWPSPPVCTVLLFSQAALLAAGRFVLILRFVLLGWWLVLLLFLRCRRRWCRTLCWPFRRPGSRSRSRSCRRRRWRRSLCRCRSRCWLLARARHRAIRRAIRWRLCAGLSHLAVRRTLCRYRSRCWLLVGTRRGTIRRPVRWLLGARLSHLAIRWSICRPIIWLCAWRTIIGSWRPRVWLRLRVGLSY